MEIDCADETDPNHQRIQTLVILSSDRHTSQEVTYHEKSILR